MDVAGRLARLRAVLADGATAAGTDALLVGHLTNVRYLTGFTGSAGLAVVLQDRAALFTDGRYTTQAAQQTDPALWERRHITEAPPAAWLAEHAP
jgi:Xaa-Pro aminopeptidase